MAKTFVMKDDQGRIGGYLIQNDDCVFCGLCHALEGTKLFIMDECGEESRYELMGKKEQTFRFSGKAIVCAYVCRGNELLMDTGERAKSYRESRKMERISLEIKRENGNAITKIKTEDTEAKKTEIETAARQIEPWDTCSKTPFPERRWPPPVVMDDAVYLDGRWVEKT